ncbi:TRAP transporter substrate-binding protein [Dermabacter sp.]|uniref:TRAP transporter substrate-binding protein n=1 Tax=Dermabacter sp. TaxID=37640 RepID=UPI0028FE9DDB|nr:TRAP transporter substrate-binding protein [Dermabacter sp.]MDU1463481.1 TRAP transporter substrate-binding protein [Dermabacter sp.]
MTRRMTRRSALGLGAAALSAAALAGCSSGKFTKDGKVKLRMAHTLGDKHPTSKALEIFVDEVEKHSNGDIGIEVFGNGVLGSETESIEQLSRGVVDIVRCAAPSIAPYSSGYNAFGLPFLFDDEEHYYRAMDSGDMRTFFDSSTEDGFRTLTYYTSGARSFYTVDKAIETPDDLRGFKIRVQNFRSQTELISKLGGTPLILPFGEIYTGLQTGLVDGAESNETALTDSAHGEVAKVFTYTEHTMIPDVLSFSEATWKLLDADHQKVLSEAAVASTEQHKTIWSEAITTAITDAEAMGVTFVKDVDREPFRELTSGIVPEFVDKYGGVSTVLDAIEHARKGA